MYEIWVKKPIFYLSSQHTIVRNLNSNDYIFTKELRYGLTKPAPCPGSVFLLSLDFHYVTHCDTIEKAVTIGTQLDRNEGNYSEIPK